MNKNKQYINESRRKHFADLQDGLDEMARHPLSWEEMKAQSDRNCEIIERKQRTYKYIFLDFDGVLNTDSYQSLLRFQGEKGSDDFGAKFDPGAVRNLESILVVVPQVRIVIESSWKIEGLEKLCRMWKERNLPGAIHDATPDLLDDGLLGKDLSDPESFKAVEDFGKGREISTWLQRHGATGCRYVILDDVPEFSGELAEHHIQIDPRVGITEADAEKAIAALNGN